MDFMKPDTVLDLNNIRTCLQRMEDTIVYNLIERGQFFQSPKMYTPKELAIPNFEGSFLDWLLMEAEKVHSKVRRYEAPDENAFFPNSLEKAILPPIKYPMVLAPFSKEVSVNNEIKALYVKEIVGLVSAGERDQTENYGSCAICDIECLQALSRRIHFGKFVAEAKFRSERERFTTLIQNRDVDGIADAITNSAVEAKILERIGKKVEAYGIDPTLRWSQKEEQDTISSAAVVRIYKDIIIPLTKKVEVDYLLRRLEWEK